MAFTYPSSGGSSPAPSLANALQVDENAPVAFYTSRATKTGSSSNSWFKYNILTPIMFNRDMTVSEFATRFNSIPNSGTMPNGADIWYHLYEGYDYADGNKPKTLIANGGIQNITDATGANATFVKALATPVVLKAYTTYWIGRALALSNGSGGTTDGTGPTYRLMSEGGEDPMASSGIQLGEIPLAHLGALGYFAQDIQDATWGTAPATLNDEQLYPQGSASVTYIKGEPA
jgi:hypothetical protein